MVVDTRPPICPECGDVCSREWVELDECWVRAWLCTCSEAEDVEEPAAWVRRKRYLREGISDGSRRLVDGS